MRSQRGHVALLMMTMLATAAILGTLAANRTSRLVEDRATAEVRTQALWLARSALDAGVVGTMTVPTGRGLARVEAATGSVSVELAGARATAQSSPPRERFVPPER